MMAAPAGMSSATAYGLRSGHPGGINSQLSGGSVFVSPSGSILMSLDSAATLGPVSFSVRHLKDTPP